METSGSSHLRKWLAKACHIPRRSWGTEPCSAAATLSHSRGVLLFSGPEEVHQRHPCILEEAQSGQRHQVGKRVQRPSADRQDKSQASPGSAVWGLQMLLLQGARKRVSLWAGAGQARSVIGYGVGRSWPHEAPPCLGWSGPPGGVDHDTRRLALSSVLVAIRADLALRCECQSGGDGAQGPPSRGRSTDQNPSGRGAEQMEG